MGGRSLRPWALVAGLLAAGLAIASCTPVVSRPAPKAPRPTSPPTTSPAQSYRYFPCMDPKRVVVIDPARNDDTATTSEPKRVANAIRLLNDVRATAGLGPVAEDANATRMAFEAARYLSRNAPFFGHVLDPSKPWYTPDAATAAAGSVLATGGECSGTELLLSGPYHAVSLLSPTLSKVGVGAAQDGFSVTAIYVYCCTFRTDAAALNTRIQYPSGNAGPRPNSGSATSNESPDWTANCPNIPPRPMPNVSEQNLGPVIFRAAPNEHAAIGSVSASITKNGVPMSICVITHDTDVNAGGTYTPEDTVFLIARTGPNGPTIGATYSVSITWTDKNTLQPGSAQWSYVL